MTDMAKWKKAYNEREKTCSGLEVTQYTMQFNDNSMQTHTHNMLKCKMKSEKEKQALSKTQYFKRYVNIRGNVALPS